MLKRLLLGTILLLGMTIQGVIVGATSIGAELCDSTSGPVITLTTPLSDSVVNTSNVTLNGTAERTSQIDISLNGAYSSSLAIGSSGQINTTIALIKGTNTINLDAYYSCNQTSSTVTVVVTYEPTAAPSHGPSTPTELPPSTGQPERPQAPPAPAAEPAIEHANAGNDPQPGPAPRAEEPHPTKPADAPGLPAPIAPTALVTAALVTPSLVLLALERFSNVVGMAGVRLPRALEWSIRGTGLILAGLAVAILQGAI